jgi:DNA-binding response OmpR family regulator/predicted signal transduction protein with EAL and GGDEF domain
MPDQPIRILVVDDDLATRLLVSEALLTSGFEPVEAEDGRQAIEHYDRMALGAILLDVHMPGIDGYEVCRRVRLRPGGVAVPILVMTASDDIDAVERAFAAGATDFMTKPLNLPLLAHRVHYMLRAAASASAARESAARLARAQRLARLVHWQLDADEQLTWTSDPLAVFWPDAPLDEIITAGAGRSFSSEHLLTYVHPSDRSKVADALAQRSAHQIEFRLQFPDGSERIVHQDAELDIGDRGVVLIGATQDITEIKRAEQQIVQLAFYDDLTGIPNRQFVDRYLRRATPGVVRSAIAIDLGTSQLDRLSAAARDALIRAATARVIERVRGADLEIRLDQVPRPVESATGPTVVARTGPDELVVLTSERGERSAAGEALQLADALCAPFALSGSDVVLRPRFGVADHPDPVAELRTLADQARTALFDAERAAPRNVVVVTAAAREQRARRAALASQLAIALDLAARGPHPELVIDYAPRVEADRARVFGVRGRARWQPIADDPQLFAAILSGDPALRDRLAAWTLDRACRDAAQWLAAGLALRIAVELPHSSLAHPGFADQLQHLFAESELDPVLFDLELVDLPSADDELERIAAVVLAVRELGCRIVLAGIDDRCTLGALRRLALDAMRIERRTIERLGPNFLATTGAIARGLGLRLAVTGIHAPAALAVLDPCGPDELAGALFGAAVPAAEVPDMVAASARAATGASAEADAGANPGDRPARPWRETADPSRAGPIGTGYP